jgi:hypothetical protein
MLSVERTSIGPCVRLPLAAAVVLTALATAVAGASAQSSSPGTIAAFLLDRGRYITIAAPPAGLLIYPSGINDQGQIVGE